MWSDSAGVGLLAGERLARVHVRCKYRAMQKSGEIEEGGLGESPRCPLWTTSVGLKHCTGEATYDLQTGMLISVAFVLAHSWLSS